MRAVLRLPDKHNIVCVDPNEEPTRYYYWPIVGWFYRRRLQMILNLLDQGPYERLLEVAYGSGIFQPSLAPLCRTLYGVDLHRHGAVVQGTLAKARTTAELITGDATKMPYGDASFDCVVNVSMLEHLKDPGSAINEMLRVLKPDGQLVLGFPCRNPAMDAFFRLLGFDPGKIHPSSHHDILDALSARRPQFTLRRLPEWTPLDMSLYCCCAVKKCT
jgi:2-polyprenyl-3-methyl-5-hydroxy-6-metoxy-1,4-benzoquinol methylase